VSPSVQSRSRRQGQALSANQTCRPVRPERITLLSRGSAKPEQHNPWPWCLGASSLCHSWKNTKPVFPPCFGPGSPLNLTPCLRSVFQVLTARSLIPPMLTRRSFLPSCLLAWRDCELHVISLHIFITRFCDLLCLLLPTH